GTHVSKHCDRELGTNCIPCIGSTYTNVPNGLSSCFTCTVCDEGHGLKVKKKCESVSDAVCEPLPRYYCIDVNNGSCRKAREHSTCLPGQYINQTGTASKDTVCSDCPAETYSDGSFTHCKLHTICGSLWQKTITQGTRSSDAVCGHNPLYLGLILGILLPVLLLIAILSVLLWNRKKISC
ncbi:tumor necrosis factor receptor superfamily member 5, partial [Silurus meridionalis]